MEELMPNTTSENADPTVMMLALTGRDIGKQVRFAWNDGEYGIDHVITGELCSIHHERGERPDQSAAPGTLAAKQINTTIEIRGRTGHKRQKFYFDASHKSRVEVLS